MRYLGFNLNHRRPVISDTPLDNDDLLNFESEIRSEFARYSMHTQR